MMKFPSFVSPVIAITGIVATSPVLAQSQIPLEISWIGKEPPEAIEIDGVGKLVKKTAENRFVGNISAVPDDVKFYDIDVQYIEDSYPLRIKVLPTTRIVNFTISRDKPLSCSDPFVKQVERSTTNRTQALKRALTAGYMLSRPGPNNHCRTHRKRAVRARYERYVNMATYSSIFSVPNPIKTEFLVAYNNSEYAINRVRQYNRSEYEREVITIQNAAILAGESDNAVAADTTNIIITRAADNPEIKDAYFSKIDQAVVEKQFSDFNLRAATAAQMNGGL